MDTGPLTFQRDEQLVFLMWLPEPGDPRSAFIRNGRVDIPVEYALSPDAASITIGFANRNSQITAEFHPDGILDGKPYQYLSGAWRWSDGQGVIQVMQFGAEQPSSGHDNMPYSIRGELTRPPGLVNYGRSRSIADSNGEWEFRYEQSGVALAEIRHEQWDHIIMRNVFADVSVPGDSERAFAGYSCGRGIGLDYFDGEYAYAIRGLFSEDGVATGWTQKPTQIVGTLHRWNRSHEKLVAIRIGDISDE